MGEHTKEALFEEALDKDIYSPGFSSADDVRNVLRAAGMTAFRASDWYLYTQILQKENEKRKNKPSTTRVFTPRPKDPNNPIDNPICPVCGGVREIALYGETIAWGHKQWKFGQPVMWHCENDQRPFSHYIRYGTYLLLQKRGSSITMDDLSHNDAVIYDNIELTPAWDDRLQIQSGS